MYSRDEIEAYLNARPSYNASPLAAMIRQLLESEERLQAELAAMQGNRDEITLKWQTN